MRFKIEKEPFSQVLQNLITIIPTKSTLQVLTNFLLSLKGESLTVTATDLDISMSTTLTVKGESDGDLTVNARKFFEIVRELPSSVVDFSEKDHVLQITAAGFSCKLAGADATDFPAAPLVDSAVELAMPGKIFQKLVDKTSFAVAQDGTRRSLNGILWDIRDKQMVMVATDGHKLGYAAYRHSFNVKGGKSVILAPKAMSHIVRLISEQNAEVANLRVGSTYLTCSVGGSSVTSKLIEGPYPNYEQVIPKSNNKRAGADKNELLAALRRVSILSSAKTHQVKFALQNDQLELSAVNRDFGAEAFEKVSLVYAGEPMEIGFNAAFFSDILKLTDSPRVRLSLNTSLSACLFHPEGDEKAEEEYFFLLMPLRLMSER